MTSKTELPPLLRYEDAEAAYRSRFAPIPVGNNKEPLLKNWTKRDPSPEEIAERIRRYPNANTGLLAGTAIGSDVIVAGEAKVAVLAFVDIDDDRLVAFALAALCTFVSGKKGAKGLTVMVQAPTGVKSCKIHGRDKSKPLVEFFVHTGMVVIPPSLHPKGHRYQWIGTPLLEADLSTLPVVTEDLIAIVRAVLGNENAWTILDGGADVAGHQPMLALTSSGIANLTDDLDWLADCLAALFHPDYKGDTKSEILGMLKSAKTKGLGSVAPVRRDYDPGEDGPVPLGYVKDGNYALFDRVRQIIVSCSSMQLLSSQFLVGLAPSDFWTDQFSSKKGFDSLRAGEALIAACRRRGAFLPEKARGRGIWREGERIVVNLGQPVESDQHLYMCFEPIPLDDNAGFDASRLLHLLRMFHWRDPNNALFLFGWLALAPICGVLRWRPHCFVYGPARSGKTTIHSIATVLLHPLVVAADGQATEAGIRQSLGPDSLPVILDEFESDQGAKGLQKIIRLARSASSADTPVLRGTPDGKPMQFNIRTAFLFAAINPRGMAPADQSRIMMLELLMHDNDSDKARFIAAEEAHLRSLGPAWCSYMISKAGLIDAALDVLEPLIPAADRRLRQNVSTILGAGFVALHGRVPEVGEARTLVDSMTETIGRHGEEVERDDAMECLEHLYAHVIDNYPMGHWLATELMRRQGRANGQVEAARIVAMHDIIVKPDGETVGFLIRHGSPAIERIFQGTQWGNGAWQRALHKLVGSFSPPHPVLFSGSGQKSRCVGLPLSYLPEMLPDGATAF